MGTERMLPPRLHGRDHRPGGPDPVPFSGATIEQGAIVIPNLIDLIVGQGLKLQDDGGGIAELFGGIIGTWTPALHQSTIDPTGTWSSGGQYAKLQELVYAAGTINFGSGFTNGTGFWEIHNLPFNRSGFFGGTAFLRGFLHDHQMFFWSQPNVNSPSTTTLTLGYQDAVPVSSRKTFDGTVWGATWNGDFLAFDLVYFTGDSDP